MKQQNNETLYHLQQLLLQWLASFRFRRYDLIKAACNNLTQQAGIQSEKPHYLLFYPLYRHGVVEYIGDNRFALAPSLRIHDKHNHLLWINPSDTPDPPNEATHIPGICYPGPSNTDGKHPEKPIPGYRFDPVTVLRQFPTLSAIIDTFEKGSYTPFRQRELPHAEILKENNGYTYTLVNHQERTCKHIPEFSLNPDALALARCQEKVWNQQPNGFYHQQQQHLILHNRSIPVLLYRLLALQALLHRESIQTDPRSTLFPCITYQMYKEINRILSHSIQLQP